MRNPYSQFRGQRLTLNDYLAIDRTVLSNERTMLAYARTALALVVVGGTCIKLFDTTFMRIVGVVFALGGTFVAGRGWWRYGQTKALLAAALEHETGDPGHPLAGDVNPGPDAQASKKE
jgi:putative membrane protein